MGSRIRVIVDSVSDLPRELAADLGIEVFPIYFSLGDRSYADDGSTDLDWFYAEQKRLGVMPTTAAPPPQEFLEAYQALAMDGAEHIVGLFLSSNLSSIVNNARIAAQQMRQTQVHVIDTQQVSMGMGWMAVLAAETIAQGATIDEVLALLADLKPRTQVLGVLNSLDYLRQGGRVSWATAQIAGLLQIKPMIAFEYGEAKLVRRVRTLRRALRQLVTCVKVSAPLVKLAILRSTVDMSNVHGLHEALIPFSPERPIPIVDIGPVFGSHVGPACLGVAFVREPLNLQE